MVAEVRDGRLSLEGEVAKLVPGIQGFFFGVIPHWEYEGPLWLSSNPVVKSRRRRANS
jgi:hypothetical protein